MFEPSSLEMLLLVVLLTASVGGFLWRFLPVLSRILASKRDADFSLFPIGPRIRDFVWEVLLQGKVIRERPLPGIAHAFVFWGFCVFGLVTINHLATGFGVQFLDRDSWAGAGYYAFAWLFAVAVSVSIAGLFVRRFLIRPKWLGEKVSIESGWIACLIFLLMISFLASFQFDGSRIVWWTHTLVLLIFLPLVPHTKHLHLILSPFSIFLSRGSFAQIPPLQGDEDFGLVTGKDITQLVALQAYSCVECGRCTEHCPANNTGKLLDPKAIALGFRGYLNDAGPTSEQPLLGVHLSQEAAFQCTTCGACENQCPVGVEHVPMIVGLRRGAVNTGAWEDDRGTKLFLALERNGNSLGFSPSERDKFIAKEQFPAFDGTQDYCLWLGCMGAYDPRGREILAAFAQVMTLLGTSFGVLKKEKCTGDPARRLGNDLVFQQLAESNLELLDQAKVRKIVSICPHCVRTISNDWKEYAKLHTTPEIEHHSEFMARHQSQLEAKRTAPKAGEQIAYHDPCYLGRYRNVYEEPRQVVELGGQVVDPPRSRERGFCCGAGGGLAFLGEESGERVSHNRAKELTATGAQTIAAACPFCQTMLRDGLSAVSSPPPKLLDISEIALAQISSR